MKRVYGLEKTISDVVYNKSTKEVFFTVDGGFFGKKTVGLVKNAEGTYDMNIQITKEGVKSNVRTGKTFPIQDKEGNIVEGMSKGSIGLGKEYSKELEKEIVVNNNAIFFTIHKLKEPTPINETFTKVGWVTGQYGIEIEDTSASVDPQEPTASAPEEEIDEDEIPF